MKRDSPLRFSGADAAARLLRGRFTGLTIVLVILALLVNAVHELRQLFVDLTFSVLLLFAISSVGRRLRLATAALALPVFISQWVMHATGSPISRSVAFAFATAFLAYLTLVILLVVLQNEEVTADTIVGAVCAYLLLGVTWGYGYSLIASISRESFSVSPALAAAVRWSDSSTPIPPLMEYYSLATLSTLGYGDITPLSTAARLLSVLEGMTGQLYVAVLIARLVGMHAARSPRR